MPIPFRESIVVSLLGVFFLFGTAHSADTSILPETGPGMRCGEILEILNSENRDALVKYARKHFTPAMLQPNVDSIVDFLMTQRKGTGGFEVRRVIQSADEQITVLLQGREATDRWIRLVVGVEAIAPHRVQGLFMYRAAAALAEEPRGEMKADEIPQALASLIDRLAKEDGFSGSVCLSKSGVTLLDRAWGLADREIGITNQVDTQFGIASLGKMFTSVAIAQLVEEGRLGYHDQVSKYIPDWLGPESQDITIEQLLTHTSGLGDYLGPAMDDRSKAYDRLEDYRSIAVADQPAFQAGERFSYSNTGFLLLGAVIQKVSGDPWDRYLETHVFDPAGMEHTNAYRPPNKETQVATGYYKEDEDGPWLSNREILVGRGTSAGGSASTAKDLVAFGNALIDGTLVSPTSLEIMTTPYNTMQGTGMYYGCGVMVSAGERGKRVFGHEGGFPGVSSLLEIYEENGYVLAVVANQRSAQHVSEAFRDMLKRSVE